MRRYLGSFMTSDLFLLVVLAIIFPIFIFHDGIKYWKMRKFPGYEWYALIYVSPLAYISLLYAMVTAIIKDIIDLPSAICMWTGGTLLFATMIYILCKKKKAGTFEPGKEKVFIPGILLFSFLIIIATVIVVVVVAKGSI